MLLYVLHTTIEIKTIEFHPDNPNLLFGGCLSGQIMVWDFSDESLKVVAEDDTSTSPDEEGEIKKEEEEDTHDKSTQSVTQMKSA
jgi:WD40 repeat protein